jgi:hypothetical protein
LRREPLRRPGINSDESRKRNEGLCALLIRRIKIDVSKVKHFSMRRSAAY